MHRVLQTNLKTQFSLIAPLKLSRLVDRKLNEASTYQKSRYSQFSQIFMKLYIIEKRRDKKLSQHTKAIQNQCLNSARPVQGILQYFQRTSSSFNQKYLVEVFENLVKALRISQQDNSMSFDHGPNDRLFYLPAFDHLIQQFKYGMKHNVFISWSGMTKIVNCLAEIGYVDAEIIDLLIEKIAIRLGVVNEQTQSKDNQQFRLFQGQKKRYYDKGGFNKIYQQVLSNKNFSISYNFMQENILNNKARDVEKAQLQEKISSQESKEIIKTLLDTINDMNTNLETMVEAIIAIRQQYRRMCIGSTLGTVLSNVQLNDSILEIQEELLNLELINIQDVKTMHNKINQSNFNLEDLNYGSIQNQRNRVQQVLIKLLKSDENISAISSYLEIQQFEQIKQSFKSDTVKKLKNQQIQQLSSAWIALVRLANSPYQLKKSTDSVSLLSLQWEKNIMRGNQSVSEFLPVERIFRKAYAKVLQFSKENIEVNRFICSNFGLSKIIEWIQSLYEIGLYDQASNIFKLMLTSNNIIEQLDETFKDTQLYSLINSINYLQSSVQVFQDIKYKILLNFKQTLATRTSHSLLTLSSSNLLNIIDFLYLSFDIRKDQNNKQLYQSLVDQVDQRIQSLSFNKNSNSSHQDYDFLVKAFRILSFERPKQYQFASFQSFYDSFQQKQISKYPNESPYPQVRQNKGSSKFLSKNMRNPYKKPILNTIHEYTNNSQQNSEIIITGFGAIKPQSQTSLNGLYVCDSTESSFNGKHINGNTRAYLKRVKQFYGVNTKPISTNQFLDINYGEKDKINSIRFKDTKSIISRLNNIYAQSNQNWSYYSNFMNKFVQSAQEAMKQKSEMNIQKLKSIFFQLKQILLLIQSPTIVYDHYLAQRAKIVVILTKIKNQINAQDPFWQSLNSFFVKKIETKNILQSFDNLIKLFSNDLIKVNFAQSKTIFESKRLSMQVTGKSNSSPLAQDVELELLSYQNFLDTTFAPYNDWNRILHSKTHFQEMVVDNMSRQNKMLAKVFCPNIKQTISLIPKFKSPLNSQVISYVNSFHPYNWQSKYSRKNTKQQNQQADRLKQIAEASISESKTQNSYEGLNKQQASAIRLLTFSHQLKVNKSMKEIYQYINGFQFIQNIILDGRLRSLYQKSQKNDITRNGKAYFEYLQSRNQKIYLQSPYMNYILEKMNLVEQVKDLFEKRKEVRAKNKIRYQRGQISKSQYKKAIQKVEKQIIEKMEHNIKNKVLDNSEDQMNEASLKMVELEKNLDQFKKLFRRANSYSRWFDQDFIQACGDYQKALRLKRARAELNLVKFSIISKLTQKKSLNDKQIAFLQKWKNNSLALIQKSHSQLLCKNLSDNDKNRLCLLHSNLSADQYLNLNDLVMELDTFLNHQVIEQVQRNIFISKAKNLSQIPAQIFQFTSNSEFTITSYQKEQQIFIRNSKLNEQQIDILINMASTLKTETPFLRKRFEGLSVKMKKNIQFMNNIPLCNQQLITEYVIRSEEQFEVQYKQQHIRELKQKEGQRIWQSIFKADYKDVPSKQIAQKVDLICSRFYLFSKNVPPMFSQLVLMILQHPNTDQMTKQNLIMNIQVFKISLVFDSEDIVRIGQYAMSAKQKQASHNTQSNQTIMDRLRKSSEKNFAKRVAELL